MINGFPTNESTRKRDHTIGDENVLRRLNQQLVDVANRRSEIVAKRQELKESRWKEAQDGKFFRTSEFQNRINKKTN